MFHISMPIVNDDRACCRYLFRRKTPALVLGNEGKAA
jgi:hypothetical protein